MLGFLVETIKTQYFGFLGSFGGEGKERERERERENKTLNVFLGLFSFFVLLLNKLFFLISLKSRMVLSYCFMAYVYEDMPIRG